MEPREELRLAARHAYERGRWRHALAVAWPALFLAGLSLRSAGDLVLQAALAVTLLAVAVGFAWRGGPVGRAVRPGLAVGLIPYLLPPLVFRATCGTESCDESCLVACAVAGGAAGLWLAWRAHRSEAPAVLAAGLIASLTASLGCAPLGLGPGLVAVGSLLAAALPVVARWRRA